MAHSNYLKFSKHQSEINYIDQVLRMENNSRLIRHISAHLVPITEIPKKKKKEKKNSWQQPGLRIIANKGAHALHHNDCFRVRTLGFLIIIGHII